MSTSNSEVARLIIYDVDSGPHPEWYLPSLIEQFDVHVLWGPGVSAARDRVRASAFDAFCAHTPLVSGPPVSEQIADFGRAWRADGVVGFGELAIIDVHLAAAKLGLPGNRPWAVDALRDKHRQRILLAKAGIPVPRFAAVGDLDELQRAVARVGAPAVLKPIAGVGSMATYRVDEATDLATLWEEACVNFTSDNRGSSTTDFVLEEFLVGAHRHGDARYGFQVSVESLVADGRIIHLTVTDKLAMRRPFREVADIMPSVLSRQDIGPLLDATGEAIKALGITDSAVHTEFMLTASGPRIIEVNSRVGGGVTELLYYSHNFDIVRAMAIIATGGELPAVPLPQQYAGFFTPQSPEADVVVDRAPMSERLRALPGVREAEATVVKGDRPAWKRGTHGGTVARLFATASSADELLDLSTVLDGEELFSYAPVGRGE
ncbi:ATP-grasp domain-containing protein [Streptomyces sp. NBC_01207]|uniref:ATP-grasp domain-containing protein n=1 Tax=Streptomyces sp. NBC_01207 TaxID=2903772 RepID=UPI002E107236|nr:ATP-grasp domain-containing protein [Streptomyces sp. NBC_01207]